MFLRGGAYEDGVYVCEPQDMDEAQSLLQPVTYAIDPEMISFLPSRLRESVSPRMRALKTNGNGACGIHASLGEPVKTAQGFLEFLAADARDVAVRQLGPSLDSLLQRPGVGRSVEAIRDAFWDGFAVAHLQGQQDGNNECKLF